VVVVQTSPSPAESIARDSDVLQGCYEQAARRDPALAGRVELHIALDASGGITRLNARAQPVAPAQQPLMELVARCIEAHVRLVAFARPPRPDVETTVPLVFERRGIPVE
jgi:hypothetical protein